MSTFTALADGKMGKFLFQSGNQSSMCQKKRMKQDLSPAKLLMPAPLCPTTASTSSGPLRGNREQVDESRNGGVSISHAEFCTLSKTGVHTDVLMRLLKRIGEKECKVRKVYPLARSFLVGISSRMLVCLYRPIHLLSVHFSRFDMLTP